MIAQLMLLLPLFAAAPQGGTELVVGKPMQRAVTFSAHARAEHTTLPMQDWVLSPLDRRKPEFKRGKLAPIPDVVELVFLARTRPVRVQLKLTEENKPIREKWEATFRELFAGFDRDRDGFLNQHEVEFIFSKNEMTMLYQGGFAYRGQAGGTLPKLQLLDRDADGRVNAEEFSAYFEDGIEKILILRPLPYYQTYGTQDTISPELFARLDANKDGKLSEEELQHAPKLIAQLDSDEDECVTMQEFVAQAIVKTTAMPGMTRMATPPAMGRPANLNTPNAVLNPAQTFLRETPPEIIAQIIKKYDTDADGELSEKEIRFEPAAFKKYDTNSNGKIDAKELDAWRTGSPDVRAFLNASTETEKQTVRVELGDGAHEGIELPKSPLKNIVVLRVHSQTIEFGIASQLQTQQLQARLNPYAYLFPADKTELKEADLVGPQFQFLRIVFDFADGNSDGKLTREEFDAYFDRQMKVRKLTFGVVHIARVPNLFQLLDANNDGKLSMRELKNAYARLQPFEPDGGKAISQAILQPTVKVRFGDLLSVNSDTSLYQLPQSVNYAGAAKELTQGPIWFRKMDRNGDLDISPAEFLGSKADFEAIDTDHDGLISLNEAMIYDKKMRK